MSNTTPDLDSLKTAWDAAESELHNVLSTPAAQFDMDRYESTRDAADAAQAEYEAAKKAARPAPAPVAPGFTAEELADAIYRREHAEELKEAEDERQFYAREDAHLNRHKLHAGPGDTADPAEWLADVLNDGRASSKGTVTRDGYTLPDGRILRGGRYWTRKELGLD